MANQEHLDILRRGVEVWNGWRRKYPDIKPNLINSELKEAELSEADLSYADLSKADLRNADLKKADLSKADLLEANLGGADLSMAHLIETNLTRANLRNADLSSAVLREAYLNSTNLGETYLSKAYFIGAYFNRTDLSKAHFSRAYVGWTHFGDTDLSVAEGLNAVYHTGPSTIGIDTIYSSKGNIPEAFLQGAGVPDSMIEYMRFLFGKPIEYYTCFISYSSRDEAFARRLHADLQSNNVRCWFAPEDLKIGDKIRQRIDESIRLFDKLLLVLSEHSIASNWVAYEVEKALNKEPEGIPNVLFPVRLDDAVMKSMAGWADDIRRTRHIGDFTHWKNHDEYQKAFTRLLRDLKAELPSRL